MKKTILNEIQKGQIDLESALGKVGDGEMKNVLLHALEVNAALGKETDLLGEGRQIQKEDDKNRQMACHLSEQCARRAVVYGKLLALEDETENKKVLQKLIAAEDQTIFALRKFL